MRKATWHFRSNLTLLDIRVALDFKSTPLKTVLENLDLPRSYDCFHTTNLTQNVVAQSILVLLENVWICLTLTIFVLRSCVSC